MHENHNLVFYALHTQKTYICPYNIRLKGTLMLQKTKCRFILSEYKMKLTDSLVFGHSSCIQLFWCHILLI